MLDMGCKAQGRVCLTPNMFSPAMHPHSRLVGTGTLYNSEQPCLSASPGHRPVACSMAGLRALQQTDTGCTALSSAMLRYRHDQHSVACCTADLKAVEWAIAQAAQHCAGLDHSISLAVTKMVCLAKLGGWSQAPRTAGSSLCSAALQANVPATKMSKDGAGWGRPHSKDSPLLPACRYRNDTRMRSTKICKRTADQRPS